MFSKKQWYYIYLLVAAVLAVYFNSLYGSFQFDDYNVIVDEPTVHSFSAWFSDLPHSIRPLLKFTYTINWVSGFGAVGFHLFNITVHLTNVILIYLLSCRLAALYSGTNPCSEKVALFTAFLFAVHPVQTEAVTYICGRSSSLMAMFYLGSLLSYDYGVRLKKKLPLYLISPLLFIMAVAVKETAITLPFALILWEAVSHDESKSWKRTAGRQALHWFMFICLLILVAANTTYLYLLSYSADIRNARINLLSQINGIFYLMSRIILINRLNIDPDLPVISTWTPLLFVKAFILLSIIFIGLLSFRKRHWLGFGILWFFLHLIPTNSAVPRLDIANERHLYLPVWGIFLILSIEIERLRASLMLNQKSFRALIIILSIILGYFTVARNNIYRSEIALWEDTVKKSPEKARVYNNLGYAYALSGMDEKAKNAYLTALSLKPDYQIAKNNLEQLLSKPR